jgi:hypothetical protein
VNQLIDNLKHLPSTIGGLALAGAALPQSDAVRQLMSMSPRIANAITTTALVCGAIAFVCGRLKFGVENGSQAQKP